MTKYVGGGGYYALTDSANVCSDGQDADNRPNNGEFVPEDGNGEMNEEIEDIITIEVKGDDITKYYVKPNETFIVQVHVSNPDNYEIQSFTLNGQKYASYMFGLLGTYYRRNQVHRRYGYKGRAYGRQ